MVECVACLGFSAITTLAGRAMMASASESTLLPSVQKRLRSKETAGTPEPLRQKRSNLAETHAAESEALEREVSATRSATAGAPVDSDPASPLRPDARDELSIEIIALRKTSCVPRSACSCSSHNPPRPPSLPVATIRSIQSSIYEMNHRKKR